MPWQLLRRHSVEPGRAWRTSDQRERRRGPRVRGRQTSKICVGLSLREGLALAARLGFEVRQRRRHGEVVVSHVTWAKPPLVINARRKDATRQLVRVLRRATDALAAKGAA